MTLNFDNFIYTILEFTKFSDLPDEAPYGFWISPNGDFFPVTYQTHGHVAMEIIYKNQYLNDEYEGQKDKLDVNLYLKNKKWLRIVKSYNTLNHYLVDVFYYDNNNIPVNFFPTNRSISTAKSISKYYSYGLSWIKE